MKSRGKWVLPTLIILILAFFTFVFIGFGKNHDALIKKIKLGLDIEGGVSVVYEGQQKDLSDQEFSSLMDQTKSVLSRRINNFGLTEPVITREGNNKIRIELPGTQDATKALDIIGKTAILEFYVVDPDSIAAEKMQVKDFKSNLLVTGKNIKDSFVSQDQYGQPIVSLKLDDQARDAFREASKNITTTYPNRQGQIAIVLDNEVISAPRVSTVLDTNNIMIEGKFTVEDAKILADLIKGGSLPIELKEVKTSIVDPTLGKSALEKSVKAALIGFLITVIIMIFFYRLAGLLASISLVLYASLLFATFILLKATMTLPGIAGLVLSIGMAVDANIIIFENLKDEIGLRHNIFASVKNAYKDASRAIFDSNTTTLLAAIVLYQFGEGRIRGFAITLMLGIIFSIFTAIFITRLMLNSASSYKSLQNPMLYGKRSRLSDAHINFVKFRKLYWAISLVVILIGISLFFVKGLNYGIDFKGGTRITININQEFNTEDVESAIESKNLHPKIDKDPEDSKIAIIKTQESLDSQERSEIFKLVQSKYSLNDKDFLEGEQFGASVGKEITRNALISIFIATICMLVYVWFRFQFLYGAISIIALLHDVLVMLSFYVLLQIVVNSTFIAAILTIVGYSINDTIVIFDRIRSNLRLLKKGDYDYVVNHSMTQSLRRTILTSLTTFVTVFALFLFGSASLREFALPLMAGIITGTYSSIFFAGPTWSYIKSKRKN